MVELLGGDDEFHAAVCGPAFGSLVGGDDAVHVSGEPHFFQEFDLLFLYLHQLFALVRTPVHVFKIVPVFRFLGASVVFIRDSVLVPIYVELAMGGRI
jgi:hypothetical protein